MTTRTGKCFLCGEPSNPSGIGGRLERCLRCIADGAKRRRTKWATANPQADRAAKQKYAEAHREEKYAAKMAWNAANRDRVNTKGKEWKKRNPEAMERYRLRKYGLTPKTYESMLVAQDRRCAICRGEFGKKGPCVDHHHDSNKVRGLLCITCNAALGGFKESHQNLLAAVDYLVEHGDVPGMLP